ncbi:hypothetical protein C4B25_04315 [Mycoplasma todarodis]|uniref:DUF1146 domain-containing protein n=1 Tax=Mycoplasma todarodis TaxID=1937191 RepID=A0A4R0XIL1_9MOLU|nr:hypothetical protein C4B25_04315 [Mycoplasma todarodis]
MDFPAWAKIVTYFLSIALVGYVLIAVDWTKIIRTTHKSFGIVLYIIVSLALGYGLGSLVVEIVSLAIQ